MRGFFDWRFYISHNKDVSGLVTENDAMLHWHLYGRKERRLCNPAQVIAMSEPPCAEDISCKIAVIAHIGNRKFAPIIYEYLQRLPRQSYDLYVTYYDKDAETVCKTWKPTKKYFLKNKGADILPFLTVLSDIADNYDAILKVHTKSDEYWRTVMLDALLPKDMHQYKYIFYQLQQNCMIGSETYLFETASQPVNASIIDQIVEGYAPLDAKKIAKSWDILRNGKYTEVNVPFYAEYHPDVRILRKRNVMNDSCVVNHFKNTRHESTRIGNEHDVLKYAEVHYNFFAGTMFWMPKSIAQHCKSLFQLKKNVFEFESGYTTNVVPRVTHSWEYLFGIMGCQLGNGLIGRKSVLFLLPETSSTCCGGTRTVLRMIEKIMQCGKYAVKIGFCGHNRTLIHAQRSVECMTVISKYDEISNIDGLENINQTNIIVCDTVICTGWQTFTICNQIYKNGKANQALFFCQDLEYLFPAVEGNASLATSVKEFYQQQTIPAITMSKFLCNHLTQLTPHRPTRALRFGINTEIYYDRKQIERSGIAICYIPEKARRLPELVRKMIKAIYELKLNVPIYTFGSDTAPPAYPGVTHCGILTTDGLAKLYNQCEVGVVFSNSNISRLAFEMRACNMVVIELENDYTKYDLEEDQFVMVPPKLEQIVKRIRELYSDKKKQMGEYHRRYETYWETIKCHDEALQFVSHFKELTE